HAVRAAARVLQADVRRGFALRVLVRAPDMSRRALSRVGSCGDLFDDPRAVEAAVLDEYRARVIAGDRPARDEQIRDVRLERLWIVMRRIPFVERDPGARHQI